MMTKRTFSIEAANLEAVRAYIRQQFEQLSWWPAEQPWKAKEEFEMMQDTPEKLTAWCEKWLDGGQRRQVKNAVQKSISPARRS